MKKNRQSGQAIMELLVLLLSFIIVFLGLLLVMGLSITNIEALIDAKFDAENKAQFADFGGDGKEISHWRYTRYEPLDTSIPFLPGDEAGVLGEDLDSFNFEFNNEIYSENNDRYVFNNFGVIDPKIADNFAFFTPTFSFQAANLLRGRTYDINDEHVSTVRDHRYFQRQKIYEAFECVLGVSLKDLDLENTPSNQVFMPAMKVKD